GERTGSVVAWRHLWDGKEMGCSREGPSGEARPSRKLVIRGRTPRDVTSSGAGRGGANLQQEVWSPTLTRPKGLPRGTPEGILAAAFRERKRTYNPPAAAILVPRGMMAQRAAAAAEL